MLIAKDLHIICVAGLIISSWCYQCGLLHHCLPHAVKQKSCRIIPLSHGELQFLPPSILFQTYHFTQHTILHYSTISTIQTVDYSIKVLTSKCMFYKSIWSHTLYAYKWKWFKMHWCSHYGGSTVTYILLFITTVTNNSSEVYVCVQVYQTVYITLVLPLSLI